jgi:hemerythrin-like domain-containing protein
MPTTVKVRPAIRKIHEDCPYEANDPVFLLRNEHSMLLGKLRLLEQGEKDPGAVKGLLQTIIRDSEVHFQREAFLLDALAEKLEFGGRSFHRLIIEHETLLNMARQLFHTCLRFSGDSGESKEHECLGQRFGEFARQFRDHIHHVEKVVYGVRTHIETKGD